MICRRHFLSGFLAIFFACVSWVNFVPSALAMGGTLPELNRSAPSFSLPTNTGDGKVALSDYLGKWVVLYFYPQDFTPGCTIEARRFQTDLPKYIEKNTQIIGVSADDVDSHAEFCDSEGLKFPLLADTDGKVSQAYGSWMSFFSMRHTFIIDPKGILRDRFVKVNPTTHSQEVFARLNELQQAAS